MQIDGLKAYQDIAKTTQNKTQPLRTANTNEKASFASTLAMQMGMVSQLGGSESEAGSTMGSFAMSQMLNSTDMMSSFLTDDASGLQNAILMLCGMMAMGGDISMGAMIVQLAASYADMTDENKALIRDEVLQTNHPYQVLERVDHEVFGNDANTIPYAAGKAVNPAVTSRQGFRSPAQYQKVVRQFDVETNGRYKVNKRGRNDTYCNIFAWDVTRAMGAEIPHYVDAKTQQPRYYPDIQGARELNAAATYDWLGEKGAQHGWVRVSPQEAQRYANSGCPAVASFRGNSKNGGHIMVVVPSQDGQYHQDKGVAIAQAGNTLTSYTHMSNIYGKRTQQEIAYYVHL